MRAIPCLVLATLALSAACVGEQVQRAESPDSASVLKHIAPHGGTLVELGDEQAHLEFVLDSAAGSLTAYVLDGEAEHGIAIRNGQLSATLLITGDPLPEILLLEGQESALTGERTDSTSVFRVTSPKLKGRTDAQGIVAEIDVKAQRFSNVQFSVAAASRR